MRNQTVGEARMRTRTVGGEAGEARTRTQKQMAGGEAAGLARFVARAEVVFPTHCTTCPAHLGIRSLSIRARMCGDGALGRAGSGLRGWCRVAHRSFGTAAQSRRAGSGGWTPSSRVAACSRHKSAARHLSSACPCPCPCPCHPCPCPCPCHPLPARALQLVRGRGPFPKDHQNLRQSSASSLTTRQSRHQGRRQSWASFRRDHQSRRQSSASSGSA